MNSYPSHSFSQQNQSFTDEHSSPNNHQFQQQQLINRIKSQYLPQLRKQIHQQVYKQLQANKQQLLAQKTEEIKQFYTNKLQDDVARINMEIKGELDQLREEVVRLKKEAKTIKDIQLSQTQKEQLIQLTLEEILTDPNTLQQLKTKLHKKQQQLVLNHLQSKLKQQLEIYQEQIQKEIAESSLKWQQQRQKYWHEKSEEELAKLAEQYSMLEQKKKSIQESLTKKKKQRDNVIKQYRETIERNQEIASLKKQIKNLK